MGLLKKTSFFLAAFFIAYPALYLFQLWQSKNAVDQKDLTKIALISQMLNHSSGQNFDEVFANMFDAYLQTESISYYVLRDGQGRLIYPSSENALRKEADFQTNSPSQVRQHVQIQGQDYVLFFGKEEVPFTALLTQILREQREVLFIFCLGVILLIYQVAAYFLHIDVKHIIHWFKGRAPQGSAGLLSSEAQRLQKYIQEVENRRQEAELRAEEYKSNSYSGLAWAHEQLRSGITQAEVVAGRCDINNYTVLKQKISPELLQYIAQSFFNRGGEYLARYGAYKENAAGDEISFFVPQNEQNNPLQTSLHLVRGLFEIFEDLNQELHLAGSPPLSLKAALDSGTVEIEKLGGNTETEGQVFINTARFLTTIEDKSISSLTLLHAKASSSVKGFSFHHEALAYVKNYETPFHLSYYHGSASAPSKDLDLKNLDYYRTDRDLTQLLQYMKALLSEDPQSEFQLLRRHLAGLRIERVHPMVVDSYQALLTTALAEKKTSYLASVALLAKSLLTHSSLREEVLESLRCCLQHEDKRVASNAREALHHLNPQLLDLRGFLGSSDHRMAVEALIDLCKNEGLTDELWRQLAQWLQSPHSPHQLSATYAVYKIYSYWSKTAPEYLELNPNFKAMDDLLHRVARQNKALEKWRLLYIEAKTKSLSATG